ncbi:PIN domain-containing protein [Candidatus Woesearchaeota archaeon]|nr:PIN domain-containing protein [Candidatus Woesearchaeota archaeon]
MTFTKTILDASAWIEYFDDSVLADQIEHHLMNSSCVTLSITVAEVVAKILKTQHSPDEPITAMRTLSAVLPVDEELSIAAARIYVERRKSHSKFALSDAFLVALARRLSARIVTKDNDFAGLKEAIVMKKI